MEMRRIGRLDVSLVGLGCNNFGMRIDEARATEVVHAALDEGITLFDTADVYGGGVSEQYLGRALGPRRDEALIATKFGSQMSERVDGEVRAIEGANGASARWVKRAVEDSLRRLGTDRIDLYQLHQPDPDTPIEETLGALDELVSEGKVLALGNSNFSGAEIEEADNLADAKGYARFICAQNHYSLLHRDPEVDILGACERRGLTMLPYFPLASGLLTGKYTDRDNLPEGTRLQLMQAAAPERAERFLRAEMWETAQELRAFAAERSHQILELAFSWLAAQPTVASVIAGATSPEQVRSNAAACSWKLDDDELAEIDRITKG